MSGMGPILCIAIAMIVGLLSTRLMKLLHLPNVTGFLLAGIVLGPYALGQFIGGWESPESVEMISWITDIALGFIAFTIGTSFKTKSLKALGPKIIVITILEALGGATVVIGSLFFASIWLRIDISVILTLGAIACATAPAATLMVIRQYKARGPVVNTLIPVVAFDDAVALIAYAILFAIAKGLASGNTPSVMELLVIPLLEIVISLGIGALLGLLVSLGCKIFKSRGNRLIMSFASILVVIGLNAFFINNQIKMFGFDFEISSLLSCMMISAVFVNMRKDSDPTFERIDQFTGPLFMLFFIISGAELNLSMFANPLILGIAGIYIVARCSGKWLGAFTGSTLSKSDPTVKKYLGFTLIPQAGVAIGLASSAASKLDSLSGSTVGETILAVVLIATVVYELVGPIVTKVVLTAAGEIKRNPQLPSNDNQEHKS